MKIDQALLEFVFLFSQTATIRVPVSHSISQPARPSGPPGDAGSWSMLATSAVLWLIVVSSLYGGSWKTGWDILPVFQRLNKPSACLPLADPAHVPCGRAVLPPSHHTGGFVVLKLLLVWKFPPQNPHKQNTTWERQRGKGGDRKMAGEWEREARWRRTRVT